MAVTLAQPTIDCSPGNSITIAGTNLAGATLALQNQGIIAPAALPIASTSAVDGSSAAFTVPDGVTSEMLVVTGADGSTASCFLEIVPQYIQAASYALDGEGNAADVSQLKSGELDEVLRDASAAVDAYIGQTLRIMQVREDHRFRESRKIWPHRNPRNKCPLISLDGLRFITSNALETAFNVSGVAPDVYVSQSSGYFDVQAYAVGNAILLGAIQTVGFSANRWEVVYTAGYPWMRYPRAIRKATAMIATELLTYGKINRDGLGGFSSVKQAVTQYDRRNEAFDITSAPVKVLLQPFVARTFS